MTVEATPGAAPEQTPANAGTPASPAAPAPANTPAPAAAPPVETNLPETPTDDTSVTYDPTGDPALDVALSFVANLGIAKDHPAMQATATGNFDLISAHLATLGDKARGWEQMVALAKDAYDRSETAKAETAQKVSDAVVQVAGNAETWAEIRNWAAKNADPDEKAAINAMFDAGPVQARAAAVMLKNLYQAAGGTVVNPKSATRDGAGGQPTSQGPLSAKDYSNEVRALHAKLGTRMETSPEYAALRQRYAASRQ